MREVLIVLYALLVLAFAIRILLRDNLTPPARLAWLIVLIVIPYAGTVLYWLFGEVDPGHSVERRHKKVFDDLRRTYPQIIGNGHQRTDAVPAVYEQPFRYCSSINGFHTSLGNRAELMPDARTAADRLIADIDAATDHVHVAYYIWLNDHTGEAIADALIRAAGRGVTCRAMADGLGSRKMVHSPTWRRMRAAGVHTAVALPFTNIFRTLLFSRLDLRNHRKITIIDGRVTYVGSRNSADPEFRVKPKYAPWVDILLRFEGPVVQQNQLLFASDWLQATSERLVDIPVPEVAPLAGGFPAQVMGDGPTERTEATPQLFASLIESARESVTLSTPYFVPDETLLSTLESAAHRGIQVTLIFPRNNDSWVVAAASRSYYRPLLEAGCHIFEFFPGLLHAKTLVIDEQVCFIGSTNLDLRSFDLNFENNVLFYDPALADDVRQRQSDYLRASGEVRLAEVKKWSWPVRIWYNMMATVGPIL